MGGQFHFPGLALGIFPVLIPPTGFLRLGVRDGGEDPLVFISSAPNEFISISLVGGGVDVAIYGSRWGRAEA